MKSIILAALLVILLAGSLATYKNIENARREVINTQMMCDTLDAHTRRLIEKVELLDRQKDSLIIEILTIEADKRKLWKPLE